MIVLRFQDEGFVIRIIPFEETKRIITVLTKDHGVFQGMSDLNFGTLTYVQGRWSSRTQGLGYWGLEEISVCHPGSAKRYPGPCPNPRHEVPGLHAAHFARDDTMPYARQLTYQLLCDLLYNVLPPRFPYPMLFEGVKMYLHPCHPHESEDPSVCNNEMDPRFREDDSYNHISFIPLLYLILHEIGYGPSTPLPQDPIKAFKQAMDLFQQHCQFHSPFARLTLNVI